MSDLERITSEAIKGAIFAFEENNVSHSAIVFDGIKRANLALQLYNMSSFLNKNERIICSEIEQGMRNAEWYTIKDWRFSKLQFIEQSTTEFIRCNYLVSCWLLLIEANYIHPEINTINLHTPATFEFSKCVIDSVHCINVSSTSVRRIEFICEGSTLLFKSIGMDWELTSGYTANRLRTFSGLVRFSNVSLLPSYREQDIAPLEPLRSWKKISKDAERNLQSLFPDDPRVLVDWISTIISDIALLEHVNCNRMKSFSDSDFAGLSVVTLTQDVVLLLEQIVHEVSHNYFYYINQLDSLVIDQEKAIFSPIKGTKRPAIKAFLACHALGNMFILYMSLIRKGKVLDSDYADDINYIQFAYLETLSNLLSSKNITGMGRYFLDALDNSVVKNRNVTRY
ncbi:MAG: HEXXH motif-containing putative peptide modification protein [Candidatus Thiodiazotropha sp.]